MIKILTLLGNNYGGCLQAYALQKKINDLGYEAEQINYTEYLSKKITLKKMAKKIIYLKRNTNFSNFKKEKLNIGTKIKKLDDDGSIYIVGSDQIWNPQIPFDIRKNFFLSFVNDKKRKNSYAASIGTDYLDNDESNISTIKEYLLDFNNITVREKTAEKIIKGININNVTTVLDPTLLLDGEKWSTIINSHNDDIDYLLVYTLGFNDQYSTYIDEYSEKNNLKIVDINYKKRFKNMKKLEKNFGPIEFVNSIKNAKIVVTNSFHGTVFSILFHKEFYSITRGNMNSRLYDLLKMLGLEDRLINEEELDNLKNLEFNKIDYEKVDKILQIEREKSLNILKTMLR